MKSTGILKSVDELGRIVLPKKMREALEIDIRDQVEIFIEGDRIILKKYAQTCVFCNSDRDVQLFREKRVCRACLDALKAQDCPPRDWHICTNSRADFSLCLLTNPPGFAIITWLRFRGVAQLVAR